MASSRIAAPLALLFAGLAQYGYAQRGFLAGLSLLGMMGVPGFEAAMLLGAEGHGGRSDAALTIEFIANVVFYFLVCWVIAKLVLTIYRRLANDPDIERRLYENR